MIAVVSGGLREPSSSRLLADRLGAAVDEALGGASVQMIQLRDLAHDLTDSLLSGFPLRGMHKAVDTLTSADGLIAVTPVFNASYSGLFKTFFDALEQGSLDGKPVLIGATGGTPRHSLVLDYALRPMFAHMRATVAPTGVYAAAEDWGARELNDRIERAAGELAGLVVGRPALSAPDPYDEPTPFERLLSS